MSLEKDGKIYFHLCMELDEVYHALAKHYGLSDTAYYIFYVLRLSEQIYTQAKLCEALHLSKQTVFSALKRLENDGYVELKASPENQKNKTIHLTAKGIKMAEHSVDDVDQAEQNAFRAMGEEDGALLNALTVKYISFLRQEIKALIKSE